MIGTKRRSVSFRSSDKEDSPALSRRILAESRVNGQREEPSEQPATATPTLDVGRAESSRGHVRALNTQFASWVQSQLQNHPDELWEDGARDYLAHASNILEKFSDVVSWLKANGTKGGSQSVMGSQTAEVKMAPETKSNDLKVLPEKSVSETPRADTGFTSPWSSGASFQRPAPLLGTTSSFATFNSQSSPGSATASPASPLTSGVLSTGQMPSFGGSTSFSTTQALSFGGNASFSASHTSLFGGNASPSSGQTPSFGGTASFLTNQMPSFGGSTSLSTSMSSGAFSNSAAPFQFGAPQKSDPPKEESRIDGDAEEEQPSSPSVKRTEEKGILIVHEVKCRLYIKPSDPADKEPWKDKGYGLLSIRRKEDADKGTKDSKPVIIVRNDVGRILLNASLYAGLKLSLPKKNCIVAIFHTSSDDGSNVEARTFLIKAKNEEERDKLAKIINENAPTAA